jgi:hypothetical protein
MVELTASFSAYMEEVLFVALKRGGMLRAGECYCTSGII